LSIGLAGALLACATFAQAKVTPPPLPPGSAMVKVMPGMSKEEAMREDRAHRNKSRKSRDYAKDDSVGNGNGNNGNGN
jgi:hypothetical protein